MNLLLDTHVLLWWLDDHPKLGRRARRLIADADNLILVSAASIWEMCIKRELGKLRLPDDFLNALEGEGFHLLGVEPRHALALRQLPPHHRDPFDRMLIAQCAVEGLSFATRDQNNLRYENIRLVEV